jgi:cytochrome b6-f complex iron-sulfur subunit
MERKEFIKTCAGIALLGCTGMLLESCTTYVYLSSQIVENKLVVDKKLFPKDTNIVLLKRREFKNAIALKRVDNGYIAVYLECTHKQCQVNPYPDKLVCPCHRSEFAWSGKVLKKPAKHDLKVFDVSHDDANIYIDLT